MLFSKKFTLLILYSCFCVFTQFIEAQSAKRLKPPRKASKVKSVDLFVNKSFEIYHKVFVYDSLVKLDIEIPDELEDEIVERIEQDVDSLWNVVPDILDDIDDASFMKKAKAVLNLNKAKKVLKFCLITVKNHLVGTKEEDDN